MWRSIITWETRFMSGRGLQQEMSSASISRGKLCGFIGCHNDGSMGMLYVEDAYRRQGLAASLEGYLINKQREQGMIPYAHIVNGNEASIQLQERLGLNLSDPVIWWLYN